VLDLRFYPNSRRLHVIDGGAGPTTTQNVNDECPITTQLQVGKKYHIRIEIAPKHVHVHIDGKVACQETRRDRHQFKGVTVFASDPWHEPADATISNFALDPQRDYQLVGKTPLQLKKGTLLKMIDVLPDYYTFQFDLTPGPNIRKGWGSIVHLTSTNHDCCNYGDRIPGIWFYPGSRRLYVIDGHAGPSINSNGQNRKSGDHHGGDDECPIKTPLPVGRTVQVRIDMSKTFIRVYFNGQKVCDENRKGRLPFTDVRVYASDPFYTAADATIANFKIEVGETPALQRHINGNNGH
jgi:hypothetical protein